MRAALALAVVAAGEHGCATFEDPTLIRDLRVLAMRASPAEILIDIDPERPPAVGEILEQLEQLQDKPEAYCEPEYLAIVCGLVADPARHRGLPYAMTACVVNDDSDGRCDPSRPQVALEAIDYPRNLECQPVPQLAIDDEDLYLDDPEDFCPMNHPLFPDLHCKPCGGLKATPELVALALAVWQDDPARGLAGLDIGISFRIGGEDAPPDDDVFAVKKLRMSPRIPAARTANQNPVIDHMLIGRDGVGIELRRGGCANPGSIGGPGDLDSGDTVTLYPMERDGTREEFVVPTLDGEFQIFTETITYQWLATLGSFSDASTGGGKDVFGNQKELGSDWTAPTVTSRTDVPLWVIQRDERYGVSWRETCITVFP